MGLKDDFKEVEQAVDGQLSANQVAANQATSKGNDAMEDTMVDSGRFLFIRGFISLLRSRFILLHYSTCNM